jgi:chromosome segregation ATPase
MYKPFHKSQETLIDFRKFRAKTDNRRVVDIIIGSAIGATISAIGLIIAALINSKNKKLEAEITGLKSELAESQSESKALQQATIILKTEIAALVQCKVEIETSSQSLLAENNILKTDITIAESKIAELTNSNESLADKLEKNRLSPKRWDTLKDNDF